MKKPLPRRLRVPLPVKLKRPIGLGDVIKRATSAVGIRPCGGCQKRAELLNRAVSFTGRKD
jgi:hypothetical protein